MQLTWDVPWFQVQSSKFNVEVWCFGLYLNWHFFKLAVAVCSWLGTFLGSRFKDEALCFGLYLYLNLTLALELSKVGSGSMQLTWDVPWFQVQGSRFSVEVSCLSLYLYLYLNLTLELELDSHTCLLIPPQHHVLDLGFIRNLHRFDIHTGCVA